MVPTGPQRRKLLATRSVQLMAVKPKGRFVCEVKYA